MIDEHQHLTYHIIGFFDYPFDNDDSEMDEDEKMKYLSRLNICIRYSIDVICTEVLCVECKTTGQVLQGNFNRMYSV